MRFDGKGHVPFILTCNARLCEKLAAVGKVAAATPNYTALCKRQKTLVVKLPRQRSNNNEPLHEEIVESIKALIAKVGGDGAYESYANMVSAKNRH